MAPHLCAPGAHGRHPAFRGSNHRDRGDIPEDASGRDRRGRAPDRGEQTLDEAFRARKVTKDNLGRMRADIEQSRAALRYIHLSAHLDTIAIVSERQISRYNTLRGYGSNPCSNVPAGYDPARTIPADGFRAPEIPGERLSPLQFCRVRGRQRPVNRSLRSHKLSSFHAPSTIGLPVRRRAQNWERRRVG